MVAFLVLVVLTVGLNTLLWSSVGIWRALSERWSRRQSRRRNSSNRPPPTAAQEYAHPRIEDVAVVIAAHNEELVLEETIRSLTALVPARQVFVVSDGSSDTTVDIARAAGANVFDLTPNRGKAGAIVALLKHFDVASEFSVVLLLDADTHLTPDYFTTGLPLFTADDVVAVAGRAATLERPRPVTAAGRFLVAYRNRVYIAMQYLFKFGQASSGTNVVAIVPGFASMYRSRILSSIDIDAPGLKIEDYNMTFEIHSKKLGRIAFHPRAAVALTQDPDRFADYMKQVERWNLGFWQTVQRHRFQFRLFWLSLWLFITELLFSSIALILLVPAVLLSLAASAVTELGLDPSGSALLVSGAVPPALLLLGLIVPDYVLSVLAAVVTRNPKYLLLGLAFPFMRILDAILCLRALAAAVLGSGGHGRWQSPPRRAAVQSTPRVIAPPRVESAQRAHELRRVGAPRHADSARPATDDQVTSAT